VQCHARPCARASGGVIPREAHRQVYARTRAQTHPPLCSLCPHVPHYLVLTKRAVRSPCARRHATCDACTAAACRPCHAMWCLPVYRAAGMRMRRSRVCVTLRRLSRLPSRAFTSTGSTGCILRPPTRGATARAAPIYTSAPRRAATAGTCSLLPHACPVGVCRRRPRAIARLVVGVSVTSCSGRREEVRGRGRGGRTAVTHTLLATQWLAAATCHTRSHTRAHSHTRTRVVAGGAAAVRGVGWCSARRRPLSQRGQLPVPASGPIVTLASSLLHSPSRAPSLSLPLTPHSTTATILRASRLLTHEQ